MPRLSLYDSQDSHPEDVLVVEDDPGDFHLTERSFRKSKFENNLIWLESGDALLKHLRENGAPLLIFLDVNMPKKNAKELLLEMESEFDLDELRFVLLSNSDKAFIDDMGLGKWPFIQKPLTFEKMHDFIQNSRKFLYL